MRLRGVVLASASLLGACNSIPGTSAHAIRRAEQATAASLTDPGSAQFRSVTIEGPSGLQVVCGEVRGKDRTGAYGPFDRFVTLIDGEVPMIDQDGSGRVTSSAAVPETVLDTAWNQECFTSPIATYRPDAVTNMLDPAIGPSVNDAEEEATMIDNQSGTIDNR